MKKPNILTIIILSVFILMYNSCNKVVENYFAINETTLKPQYFKSDTLQIAVLNTQHQKIDSLVVTINDQKMLSQKNEKNISIDLKNQKLGYQNIKVEVFFGGEKEPQELLKRVEIVSSVTPKLKTFAIVNTYPHDTTSFTEGLEFYGDILYEGTGQYEVSKLLKTDFKTGKIIQKIDLEKQYFGEGITFINNQIFQLTWKEMTGFLYNIKTMKLEKTFEFDKKIEGWGLTNDGTFIYQSDGTEKIWKMNPKTQKMIDYINVYAGSDKIKSVNELEWINGQIFCNIWQKDAIAVVDPKTGDVIHILDLSKLRKLVKNQTAEVLNGIAYNPKTKTIFVTGKNWDKMFEIKLLD